MALKNNRVFQAAALSLALAMPASNALALTHHRVHRTSVVHHHKKHHSETRGTVIGAVAGAVIDHKQPLKGALIGGALGNVVQKVRNKH
jgi:uncharacterized protein YcfJ